MYVLKLVKNLLHFHSVTDESTHSVAPLVTDYTETECANYCSLRGSQFRVKSLIKNFSYYCHLL